MPKPSKVPLRAPAPANETDAVVRSAPPAKPTRRRFTAAEKLRIVRQADACTERGEVEAMLRREGIYSSHLSMWRKALREHGEQGMASRTPGRKPTRDVRDARIEQLEREKARLEKELRISKKVIEIQKKVSELLGIDPLPSDES